MNKQHEQHLGLCPGISEMFGPLVRVLEIQLFSGLQTLSIIISVPFAPPSPLAKVPPRYCFRYCLVKQRTLCIINVWGYTEILL